MSGITTNGATVLTSPNQLKTALVSVDTGNAGGASPQTAAVPPGVFSTIMTLFNAALTALAGGGKAGATQLGYGINNISVCATAADSALLPYAFPGAVCFVKNSGAASCTVFGKGTDTIDAVASATGNAQANGKGKTYYGLTGTGDGTDVGTWVSELGA